MKRQGWCYRTNIVRRRATDQRQPKEPTQGHETLWGYNSSEPPLEIKRMIVKTSQARQLVNFVMAGLPAPMASIIWSSFLKSLPQHYGFKGMMMMMIDKQETSKGGQPQLPERQLAEAWPTKPNFQITFPPKTSFCTQLFLLPSSN